MSRKYTSLVFTDAVKTVQHRYEVRDKVRRQEAANIEDGRLSLREQSFIEARDSFYVASVLENGWPYLQHRGGPAGFLKVIDAQTLAFADFRGNLQYVTVGSTEHDNRVALLLMDYANQMRLKIMARVEFVDADQAPDLLAKVEDPDYRGRIERVAILKVEAFDWNCPQHITPRYTEAQLAELPAKNG